MKSPLGVLLLEKLGHWQPGSEPTKEVLTLISTRLKAANAKGVIKERRPVVPSLPAEKLDIDKEYMIFPISLEKADDLYIRLNSLI